MKVKRFKISLYDYSVCFIEIESEKDAELIGKELKREKITEEDILEIKQEVVDNKHDGGYTYRNNRSKTFCVIIFPCKTAHQRLNVIGHEKRHIEDRIAEYTGLEGIEAMGYLAGFLTEKLFS